MDTCKSMRSYVSQIVKKYQFSDEKAIQIPTHSDEVDVTYILYDVGHLPGQQYLSFIEHYINHE